jgi:hypothetical protein
VVGVGAAYDFITPFNAAERGERCSVTFTLLKRSMNSRRSKILSLFMADDGRFGGERFDFDL